jgi:hypothetical protein
MMAQVASRGPLLMRSSSGTDRDGSSAANLSATALARCSGDTQIRY